MVIFFDGPQLSGKTTLIEKVIEFTKAKLFKFPLPYYSKRLGLTNSQLSGFQLGKDLATLEIMSYVVDPSSIILIDRGPLSSIYYSLIEGRLSEGQIKSFFEQLDLKTNNGQNFIYLFITPKNKSKDMKRDKNDGFDYLNLKDSGGYFSDQVISLANRYLSSDNFIHYENDFNKNIDEKAIELINLLYTPKFMRGTK